MLCGRNWLAIAGVAIWLIAPLSGCGFDNRSAQFSCESSSDCEVGRECDMGWCVVADNNPSTDASGPGLDIDADNGPDATPVPDGPPPPDAGPPPGSITYIASVADCIDPNDPDPDVCETENGAGLMAVDLLDTAIGSPYLGFVRFDTDSEIVGKTITAVTLRLTVTDDAKAGAPASGEIYQVASFVRIDLFTAAPATIGAVIGADQGMVQKNDVLDWSLPTSLVAPNAGVYFGIMPTNDDGTSYWNLNGTDPPQLIVDYN